MTRKNYLWTLGVIYTVWWVIMAIKPHHFSDWVLENVLVVGDPVTTRFQSLPGADRVLLIAVEPI